MLPPTPHTHPLLPTPFYFFLISSVCFLQLEGPAVLQVQKLRNISAPKDNEESQAAPKLWKITLTDGHANVVAICLEPLRNLRSVSLCDRKLTFTEHPNRVIVHLVQLVYELVCAHARDAEAESLIQGVSFC